VTVPFIRYTYPADVAEHGTEPVEVPEVTVKVLTERRRAVEVCGGGTCPEPACDECPFIIAPALEVADDEADEDAEP
jgi:hypothetical protein